MDQSETKAETNVNETADEKKTGTTQAESDISDLEKKIIRQVEYEFGDVNLMSNSFLQKVSKSDDGWVPLETMLKLTRLATLSKDAEVILTAIRKSTSELIEISEDETKIRRSPTVPLPESKEDFIRELSLKTVYCDGFPLDSKFDELLEFFNENEDIISVQKRKFKDETTQLWHFNGSVLIAFKTFDAGDEFLRLVSVKYKDVELTRMWLKDYVELSRTNVNETADEKKTGTTQAESDISDLEKKIIRQVEYEFGDVNLMSNSFLQKVSKSDDGWVPLETMLKLTRLATLSKDAEVILTAIRKSTSELIEISEDETKIRRSPTVPLPESKEDFIRELSLKTVYCDGFPLDSKFDELLEFFNENEDIINVEMRKFKDEATQSWHFKGSVLIAFKTVDAGDKFLRLVSVKYKDVELTRMWLKDHVEFKFKERFIRECLRNLSGGEGEDDKKAKEEGDERK